MAIKQTVDHGKGEQMDDMYYEWAEMEAEYDFIITGYESY